MEGRKLILCQPFKIKMDHATTPFQQETTPKIEVGVDLGIKHLRQEHKNIQRKRAEYENRHPAIFHKKINSLSNKFWNSGDIIIFRLELALSKASFNSQSP